MKSQSVYNWCAKLAGTSCFVLAELALVVMTGPARGQSAKDADARIQAAALFAKALAVSDIRAPGSPPFQMSSTINLKDSRGKTATGTYLLKWAAPDQWREEIHFANYARIRVGGKDQYWQSRTTDYEIEPILQLNQGLDFLKDLHVWSNPNKIAALETVKLHQKKQDGIKLNCVTLIPERQNPRPDYCFDPATGMLVRANDVDSTIEFSESVSFEGKYFPGSIRAEEESVSPVTLQVNSIVPLGKTDSADFQAAAGSTPWSSCDAPDVLPTLQSAASPVYPMNEKLEHNQGSVFVYVIIGTDGQLSKFHVFSAPDVGLTDSALTALRQWRYTPETCGGNPVPVESLITIAYTLSE